ncbi:hypothetical protein BDW72DRAFT_85311 [Aspergillus terricola var. indicus]
MSCLPCPGRGRHLPREGAGALLSTTNLLLITEPEPAEARGILATAIRKHTLVVRVNSLVLSYHTNLIECYNTQIQGYQLLPAWRGLQLGGEAGRRLSGTASKVGRYDVEWWVKYVTV